MDILHALHAFVHRYFAMFCIPFLLLGMFLGETVSGLAFAIPWLLGLLMFSNGLGLRLQDLRILRQKPWLLPVILALFHVVMPAIALGITTALGFPTDAVIGFVLLALVPMSATAAVWTGVYCGNLTLSMALVLADTIITPFFIPYILTLFFAAEVVMDPFHMLWGLFWMLFFPTTLAIVCNRLTNGEMQRVAGKPLAFVSQLAVFSLLVINGGVVAPFVQESNVLFFLIFGASFVLGAFWFVFSFMLGRLLFTEGGDVLAFMFTGAMRTSTTGMVIAVAYFPPAVALVMVSSMFFQQAQAVWYGKVARDWLDKRERPSVE